MKLITISGLDGSGKSTQIQMLKTYLENQDKKVFYFHATQFSIANKRAGGGSSPAKSVMKANWLQIQLRKIALFIDLWRFKKLYKNLEKDGYNYILSDRYFYDTVININYLSKTQNIKYDMQRPDIAIYLQTDPDIIMSRKQKPDQGINYLQKKKELYDIAAKKWGLKIIDGNRNKEEIFEEIKSLLLQNHTVSF